MRTFVATTARSVALVTFCFVEVALFMPGLSSSWITCRRERTANEIGLIAELLSKMSPPEVSGSAPDGCGPVSKTWITLLSVSSMTIGRVRWSGE